MVGALGLPGAAAKVTVGSRGFAPVTTQSHNTEGQTVEALRLKQLAALETTVVRMKSVNLPSFHFCFSFGRRLGRLEDLESVHRVLWKWNTVQDPAV